LSYDRKPISPLWGVLQVKGTEFRTLVLFYQASLMYKNVAQGTREKNWFFSWVMLPINKWALFEILIIVIEKLWIDLHIFLSIFHTR
jgi:hypothetical protein